MNQAVNKEKLAVFAEEGLVVDAQIFLHNLMEEKGITRAELARKMGVSRPRVTQMLSDECSNLTIRLLARAVHVLGERIELDCEHFRLQRGEKRAQEASAASNVYNIKEWSINNNFADKPWNEKDERLQKFTNALQEGQAA